MFLLTLIYVFSLTQAIYTFLIYLFCRLIGVHVEKAYLWGDIKFSLFNRSYKNTEFGIGWIPFSSYVKLQGMTEDRDEPPLKGDFIFESAYKRLAVLLAGPVGILILGVLLFCISELNFTIGLYMMCLIFIHIALGYLLLLIFSFIYKNIIEKHLTFVALQYKITSILIVYSVMIILPFISIHKWLPLTEIFGNILNGNYLKYLWTNTYSDSIVMYKFLFFSVFLYLTGTIPFIGTNGTTIMMSFSEIITKEKISQKWQNRLTVIASITTTFFYVAMAIIIIKESF